MRVEYEWLHEKRYAALRGIEGSSGWDAGDALAQNLAELDHIVTWLRCPRGGRVLEVGCGAGAPAIHLARQGYDVTGVDIAPTAVEWAQENASAAGVPARFVVGNVLQLEAFEDASFDFVVDGHCLHCIIGDDRRLFFDAIRRVLRPGGAVAIRTMCNMHRPDLHGYDPETRLCMAGDIATRYIGTANDLLMEIVASGFEVVHAEVTDDFDDVNDMLLALATRP